MNEALLWLDVETTGLSHETDWLLEVAAIATTFDANLEPLGEPFSECLTLPEIGLRDIDPHVLEMHSTNGLWRACKTNGRSLSNLSGKLGATMTQWGLLDGPTVYLAGRSVHFDRGWLPQLEDAAALTWRARLNLSHRHFDLTAIKAYATLAGIPMSVPEDAHRALDDVQADITLARELIQAARQAVVRANETETPT